MVERPNFYAAAVAISQGTGNMIIIVNMTLVVSLFIAKLFQLVFFGELRALEMEHLYERVWYTITETGLSMIIYKNIVNYQFALSVSLLLFLRAFHWIISDRVDLIFQVADRPTLFSRARLASAIAVAMVWDGYLVKTNIVHLMERGVVDNSIMFAFEYALLLNSSIAAANRYILNLVEMRYLERNEEEDHWDGKNLWTFITEVASDVTRLLIYVAFVVFMVRPVGLPLHIVRDVYVTASDLGGRIRDYVRFRRARLQMDRAVADATQQELDQQEDVCIICREEMAIEPAQPQRLVPKKLSCGHVIHYGCLKSWLERSQNCPTCRTPVLGNTVQPQAPQPQVQPRPQPQHQHQPQAQQAPVDQPQNGFNPTPNMHGVDSNPVQLPTGHNGVIMNSGFQLPTGWMAVPARESNGVYEVKLNDHAWATVTDSHGRPEESRRPFASSSHHSDLLTTEERIMRTQSEKIHTMEGHIAGTEQRLAELERKMDVLFGVMKDQVDVLKSMRGMNEHSSESSESSSKGKEKVADIETEIS